MITFKVPMVVTDQDRARANAIQESEAKRDRKYTPLFIRDGLGLCRTEGDPDDFTNCDMKGNAGSMARAAAAAVCANCPFAVECLPYGISNGYTGIYGGEWLIAGRPQPRGR